jgi:hypothetical protein
VKPSRVSRDSPAGQEDACFDLREVNVPSEIEQGSQSRGDGITCKYRGQGGGEADSAPSQGLEKPDVASFDSRYRRRARDKDSVVAPSRDLVMHNRNYA